MSFWSWGLTAIFFKNLRIKLGRINKLLIVELRRIKMFFILKLSKMLVDDQYGNISGREKAMVWIEEYILNFSMSSFLPNVPSKPGVALFYLVK